MDLHDIIVLAGALTGVILWSGIIWMATHD